MSFLEFAVNVSFHEFESAFVELLQQGQHSTQDVLVPLRLATVLDRLLLLLLVADCGGDGLNILELLRFTLLGLALTVLLGQDFGRFVPEHIVGARLDSRLLRAHTVTRLLAVRGLNVTGELGLRCEIFRGSARRVLPSDLLLLTRLLLVGAGGLRKFLSFC